MRNSFGTGKHRHPGRSVLVVALMACAVLAAATPAPARQVAGGTVELYALQAYHGSGGTWSYDSSLSAQSVFCNHGFGFQASTSLDDLGTGSGGCEIELYGTVRSGLGWLQASHGIEFTYSIRWTTCGLYPAQSHCGNLSGRGRDQYDSRRTYTIQGPVIASYTGSWGFWYYEGSLVYAGGSANRPQNESPPYIEGNLQEGETVTVSPGTWSGDEPQTYVYQWKRCDEQGYVCSPIWDAVGDSYKLTATDVDHTIQVTVVAANDSGTDVALTQPQGPVTAAPST